MFSALTVIIIVMEILKRSFKKSEVKKKQLEIQGISDEEEVAISAAVITYFSDTPHIPKLIATLRRGAQPSIWNMAGRMDLMELQVRR